MRAMVVREPGGLDRIEAVTLPDARNPGPGQILVRLRASSLNYHDYAVVAGIIKTADGRVPMSDGAGEVLAVGEGVTEFAVGDLVVSTFLPSWSDGRPGGAGFAEVPGDGIDGYARELVVASTNHFTRTPKGYTAAQAATLTCAALTAWHALVGDGPVFAGQTVLVQGTGGVSIFALQFAKALGAAVIATSSSDEKLERLKALGADHVINYKREERWGSAARQLSGGGVDHVVEIGGGGTLLQSMGACRPGGHIAIIGILAGQQAPVPISMLMGKQLRVQGVTVGSRRQQLDMIRAIEINGITPVIDNSFPLEGLADAFRHQESGQHFGKICIDI